MQDTLPRGWEPVPPEPANPNGSVNVFKFQSEAGWLLLVHDTVGVDEDGPRFQIELIDEDMGLYHGHTADGVQELRGAVGALTHMANHAGAIE